MRANTRQPSMWQPLGLSIGVHVLLAAMVVLGTLNWKPFKQSKPVALTIEAVIVDTTQMAQRREEAQKAAEEAQRRQQLEEQRAEALEQQRERERRQELDRQQQVEADRQKQAEAEQQRKQAEDEAARKKRENEAKLAKMREEQERLKEQERIKQQQELEKIRQQREEAERQRKLDEERLKQLEAREKAQEAAKQKQIEEDAARAEKDRQAQSLEQGRIADLGDKYKLLLQQIVTDNWLRPPTAKPGFRCNLKIVQIPGGEVISASISGACNGDEATRRSIVAAVERVGAFPYRGFEEVFAREIEFEFKYDGD